MSQNDVTSLGCAAPHLKFISSLQKFTKLGWKKMWSKLQGHQDCRITVYRVTSIYDERLSWLTNDSKKFFKAGLWILITLYTMAYIIVLQKQLEYKWSKNDVASFVCAAPHFCSFHFFINSQTSDQNYKGARTSE